MTTLATLPDLKTHLNIPTATTTYDTELTGFLNAATPVLENICGPLVQRTVTNEMHDGGYDNARAIIVLRQRPVISVTTITEYLATTAYVLTQVATPALGTTYSYTFDVETGSITRRMTGGYAYPFPFGSGNILVTYVAGYAVIPDNVRLAALFQAAHLWQTSQQGGRPGWNSAAGEDGYAPSSSYAIPNRVIELLDAHRRVPGLA